MVRRKLFLLLLFFISFISNAQGHIITDKDGYTNMREKPTVQSRIIDRILKHEVFLLAEDICSNSDIDFSNTPPNWIAVTKTYGGEIGYVLKKNIQALDELPFMRSERLAESHRLTASIDTLIVSLLLNPIEEAEHDITYYNESEPKHIATIDGKHPKCMLIGDGIDEITGKHREITGLEIIYADKTVNLPIHEEIKDLFNPHSMIVSSDSDGGIYIQIFCGDGGEAYSVCISVVDGKVLYVVDTTLC